MNLKSRDPLFSWGIERKQCHGMGQAVQSLVTYFVTYITEYGV